MKVLIVVIAVAGALLFLLALLKSSRAHEPADEEAKGSDYEALRGVLSPAEQAFVAVLGPTLPPGVGLLAKTRLADIFTTKRGLESQQRLSAYNRISRKHVDFLLVRAIDFSPIAGIEFDDPSSRGEARRRRDTFAEAVFAHSGIPYLRIRAQTTYDPVELARHLASILTPPRPHR